MYSKLLPPSCHDASTSIAPAWAMVQRQADTIIEQLHIAGARLEIGNHSAAVNHPLTLLIGTTIQRSLWVEASSDVAYVDVKVPAGDLFNPPSSLSANFKAKPSPNLHPSAHTHLCLLSTSLCTSKLAVDGDVASSMRQIKSITITQQVNRHLSRQHTYRNLDESDDQEQDALVVVLHPIWSRTNKIEDHSPETQRIVTAMTLQYPKYLRARARGSPALILCWRISRLPPCLQPPSVNLVNYRRWCKPHLDCDEGHVLHRQHQRSHILSTLLSDRDGRRRPPLCPWWVIGWRVISGKAVSYVASTTPHASVRSIVPVIFGAEFRPGPPCSGWTRLRSIWN
ncbi:hypothetical protein GALMADRAFT_133927 [Galerina marginata CBS 339.88]|uniref:Uncharacterized protein n=1 Tax=Galerina marginata (strain CBS 339.88) TaxID=685588 RepID=A0A067TN82_GALM3|nr:hypothetical protein GALMADRAFT_133927 [Galerina marginata CBS 339.88]